MLVFPYITLLQYSDGDPLTGASNADGVGTRHKSWLWRISGYRSMTAAVRTTIATVHRAVYRTGCHASVNLCLSQQAWMTTTKRRKQNRIYLYVAVNLKRKWLHVITENCARRIVLLKLNTGRHEASRGLSATAGLLVLRLLRWEAELAWVTFLLLIAENRRLFSYFLMFIDEKLVSYCTVSGCRVRHGCTVHTQTQSLLSVSCMMPLVVDNRRNF